MNIQALILWRFSDKPHYYGEIKVNAKNEQEAREKLHKFISETGYIIEHPKLLETMYNNFNLESVDVINSVII